MHDHILRTFDMGHFFFTVILNACLFVFLVTLPRRMGLMGSNFQSGMGINLGLVKYHASGTILFKISLLSPQIYG